MSMLQGCSKAWENTSRSTTTHYHSPILRLKNCTSDWVSLNLVGLPVNWSCTCLSLKEWTQRYLTSAAAKMKVPPQSCSPITKQNHWWEWGLKEALPTHRLSGNKWRLAQNSRQANSHRRLKLCFWINKPRLQWTTSSVALRQDPSRVKPKKTILFRSTMPASLIKKVTSQLTNSRPSTSRPLSWRASWPLKPTLWAKWNK